MPDVNRATDTNKEVLAFSLTLQRIYGTVRTKDDLNQSVCGSKAVALTPDDHPNMAMCANTLGNGLWLRFERTGSMEDVNESIEIGRKAMALTPDDHSCMAIYPNNLEETLHS